MVGDELVEKPKWVDKTRKERSAKRRKRLDDLAKSYGFATWAKFETACLSGMRLQLSPGIVKASWLTDDAQTSPIPEAALFQTD